MTKQEKYRKEYERVRQRYIEVYRPAYEIFIKLYPLTLGDLSGEVWKQIPGFENYHGSNYGRVKSFWGRKPRIVKPQISPHGYLQVTLHKDSKQKTFRINRLVGIIFIPNPDNKPEVDHIDGNKFNNHVSNLRWVTSAENKRAAFDMGLRKMGGNRSDAHLTNEQVEFCRAVYKPRDKKFGATALAKMFGVSKHVVMWAVRGHTYKNAGGALHERSWLKKEQVLYIRENPNGLLQKQLAEMFGVCQTTISSIQRGITHKIPHE